jgi:hypothetical protein
MYISKKEEKVCANVLDVDTVYRVRLECYVHLSHALSAEPLWKIRIGDENEVKR